ncbi:hypothetical protein MPTK1_3g11720 [Marchantia polymorpha subsp. ruderalis]|uniref:Uncharacterized protein n=2 Tax=Marchantia polymorpha TaxID=3197 RepID=A0AAF6AZT2_MARPO|nr:hypothetical protein MARPO_0037s0025 [Marchantia polymorpha]BBN05266.1 hypothetical protein Mp_3g11720 [Marchantia polymorpha subsp. ruderalis]|eukprot:PTQ40839.1 hypothetical protein MARPO_0037s0025 [Marchantia polymorpha]
MMKHSILFLRDTLKEEPGTTSVTLRELNKGRKRGIMRSQNSNIKENERKDARIFSYKKIHIHVIWTVAMKWLS